MFKPWKSSYDSLLPRVFVLVRVLLTVPIVFLHASVLMRKMGLNTLSVYRSNKTAQPSNIITVLPMNSALKR